VPIQTGRSMPEHGNTCQDTPFLVPPGTTATQACVRWLKCTVLNTELWLQIRKTAQILNAKLYRIKLISAGDLISTTFPTFYMYIGRLCTKVRALSGDANWRRLPNHKP